MLETFIGVLSFISTIFFGVLSYIFYRKSKASKSPRFIHSTTVLHTENHPDISILYKDESVKELSRIRIVFFNAGSEAIRKDDCPKNKFPSIKFSENVKILSYEVLISSSTDIDFKIGLNKNNKIDLNFEYLNSNDGVVIEILFDSSTLGESEIQYSAPIIGGDPVNSNKYTYETPAFEIVIWSLLLGLTFCGGLIALGLTIFYLFTDSQLLWGLFIVGIVVLVASMFGFKVNLQDPMKGQVPDWAITYIK